jgi:broad specificity phosphatase PhoE
MFEEKPEWVDKAQNLYERLDDNAEFVTIEEIPVVRKTRFLQEEDNLVPEYSHLRQIALIRHGEPDLLKTGRFSFEDAKTYIKNYDSVKIIEPDEPFFMLEPNEDVAFFTSTINRAKSTARYLFGTDQPVEANEDFREFERQIGNRRFKMKLPLKYWTTSARIFWMLGWDNEGIESFSEAKDRARRGAQLLEESAEKHQKVVLVAHGFLNRYIKKNLEKQGWEVLRDGGTNYFATTILGKKYDHAPLKDTPIANGNSGYN